MSLYTEANVDLCITAFFMVGIYMVFVALAWMLVILILILLMSILPMLFDDAQVVFFLIGVIGIFLFVCILKVVKVLKTLIKKRRTTIHNQKNAIARNEVADISLRLKKLDEINNEYASEFYELEQVITHEEKLKTKQKYDKFNYDKYLRDVLLQKLEWYEDLIKKIKSNRENYKRYSNQLVWLPDFIRREEYEERSIEYDRFSYWEKKLVEEKELRPVCDPKIRCYKSYTSPQGWKRYYDYKEYSFEEMIEHLESAKKEQAEKETEEYKKKAERGKLSNTLRYEILKRDNRKCQICGRTQEDGVKLEVDHIIPIAKGGKTEPSNLRVLCRECNSGKSDQYEEGGLN